MQNLYISGNNPSMGNRIKEFRKAMRLSQEALAHRIGTTRSQLVKLERGERRLSDVWLEKLAPALGVSQGALLGDDLPDPTIQIAVAGILHGDGAVKPLAEDNPNKSISCPHEIKTNLGLSGWIMGDHSMTMEITAHSMMIVGDPRVHTYPFVPGILLLFKFNNLTFIRKYIRSPDGAHWLVPAPASPDPALKSFRFDVNASANSPQIDPEIVSMHDIIGAVMWEQRRRMPLI